MAGIPAMPLLLSVLGLIPFVGGVVAIEFAEGGWKGWAISWRRWLGAMRCVDAGGAPRPRVVYFVMQEGGWCSGRG